MMTIMFFILFSVLPKKGNHPFLYCVFLSLLLQQELQKRDYSLQESLLFTIETLLKDLDINWKV
jgi:hypothetical protein